ncbi:MAG TPA: DNA-binding domain-containing protein [Planctomycetota bacterium]|nr:DNA-binding domain-containing protein [Planctomycetota bacterium]
MTPDPDPSLASLQEWMRRRITAPGARDRRDDVEVAPSDTLDPSARLDVYAGMYFLRLREVLESDFGAVAQALGHAGFDRVVRAFLKAHPSRHYDLNAFGSRLPRFLRARSRFLSDLARVEWALTEVVHEPLAPDLDRAALAKLGPDEWEGVRFRFAPSVRLLALDFPANGYLQAVRDGKRAAIPRPSPSWLAVYRRGFLVWRMTLSRPAYRVLDALARGRTLGDALRSVVRSRDVAPAELENALFRWFRDWAGEGLFAEALPPKTRARRRAFAAVDGRTRRARAEIVRAKRFSSPAPVAAASEAVPAAATSASRTTARRRASR